MMLAKNPPEFVFKQQPRPAYAYQQQMLTQKEAFNAKKSGAPKNIYVLHVRATCPMAAEDIVKIICSEDLCESAWVEKGFHALFEVDYNHRGPLFMRILELNPKAQITVFPRKDFYEQKKDVYKAIKRQKKSVFVSKPNQKPHDKDEDGFCIPHLPEETTNFKMPTNPLRKIIVDYTNKLKKVASGEEVNVDESETDESAAVIDPISRK